MLCLSRCEVWLGRCASNTGSNLSSTFAESYGGTSVMNRGEHQESIFRDDDDCRLFLSTLEEACQKTAWQIHSFCLMSNHFHLVIETPGANLVPGMKWFLGVYTARFNRKRKVFGHLFSGRYKALPVDGSGNGYLKSVCDYAHLNPVRAGLLTAEQPLETYRWSSYPLYLCDTPARPAWLRIDRVLGEWGIQWDQPGAVRQFKAAMEARRQGELEQEFKAVGRDWCMGSEQFRQEMLQYIEQQRGKWHYAQDKQPGEARPCLKPGVRPTRTKSSESPVIHVASGAPGGAAR
jgi:putative transposase